MRCELLQQERRAATALDTSKRPNKMELLFSFEPLRFRRAGTLPVASHALALNTALAVNAHERMTSDAGCVLRGAKFDHRVAEQSRLAIGFDKFSLRSD